RRRPPRPRPHPPHQRGAAAERVPALAERLLGGLLPRRALAGVPGDRLPPRPAQLPGPETALRPLTDCRRCASPVCAMLRRDGLVWGDCSAARNAAGGMARGGPP